MVGRDPDDLRARPLHLGQRVPARRLAGARRRGAAPVPHRARHPAGRAGPVRAGDRQPLADDAERSAAVDERRPARPRALPLPPRPQPVVPRHRLRAIPLLDDVRGRAGRPWSLDPDALSPRRAVRAARDLPARLLGRARRVVPVGSRARAGPPPLRPARRPRCGRVRYRPAGHLRRRRLPRPPWHCGPLPPVRRPPRGRQGLGAHARRVRARRPPPRAPVLARDHGRGRREAARRHGRSGDRPRLPAAARTGQRVRGGRRLPAAVRTGELQPHGDGGLAGRHAGDRQRCE